MSSARDHTCVVDLLDALLQVLEHTEVAVDDLVEHGVGECRRARLGRAAGGAHAPADRLDVGDRVLADGDHPSRGNEELELVERDAGRSGASSAAAYATTTTQPS